MNIYEQKYLKYKNKYKKLQLNKLLGGASEYEYILQELNTILNKLKEESGAMMTEETPITHEFMDAYSDLYKQSQGTRLMSITRKLNIFSISPVEKIASNIFQRPIWGKLYYRASNIYDKSNKLDLLYILPDDSYFEFDTGPLYSISTFGGKEVIKQRDFDTKNHNKSTNSTSNINIIDQCEQLLKLIP